jgi:L-histidine N-alpha-methyltransferase
MQQSTRSLSGGIQLDVFLEAEDPAVVLRNIRDGLLRTPREIAPRFFYDDRGSHLFEEITRLPEYYQTRTERALLQEISSDLVARSGCNVLVELGSGASTKTRELLDAMDAAGCCDLYVPFDVNETMVRRAAEELVQRHPGMGVHGVIGDFMRDLPRLPRAGKRLVIFLGGTIGNLTDRAARLFLLRLASVLEPGEAFLLGVDRIKAPEKLEAAYNDSQGVTAAFNRNMLRVLNELAQGDFVLDHFEHRAHYDVERHRIEMRLQSNRNQIVRLRSLGLLIQFRRGEWIRTEISVKYDEPLVTELLEASGFEMLHWYTDAEQLFGLALARRGPDPVGA